MNIKKNKLDFIFVVSIPVINCLADIFVNFFLRTQINPGNIRALILLLFSLYFIFYKIDNIVINKYILLFICYCFLLSLISSNIIYSMVFVVKMSLGLLAFSIGFHYIKTIFRLKKLLISYLISAVIIVISILVSNYFEIGKSDYLRDSFYFGSSGVLIALNLAVIIISLPLLIYLIDSKIIKCIAYICIFIGILLVFISVKRGAIFSIILAFIVYILLSNYKIKILNILIIVSLFVFILFPFFKGYFDIGKARYQKRTERFELNDINEIRHEGRYIEIGQVLSSFEKEGFLFCLLGGEIFNNKAYFKINRPLHTDAMIILHGGGIIGFILFVIIYYKIFSYQFSLRHISRISFRLKFMYYVFIALYLAQIILSITHSLFLIGLKYYIFMMLGGIIAIFRQNYVKNKFNQQINCFPSLINSH